jgi:CspA family cold shock protein
MKTGKVEFVNTDSNYGFISSDFTEEDVFFDFSDLESDGSVFEQHSVSFEFEETEEGPRATKVELDEEEEEEIETLQTGEISSYSSEGGFGFVETGEVEDGVYFHVKKSNVDFEPREGLTVNIEVEKRPKGFFAVNIKKFDSQVNDALADALSDGEDSFSGKYEGEIKFFESDKGYGFVTVEDFDEDVFFHIDNIEYDEVEKGETVKVRVEHSNRGPKTVYMEK